ncbi:unnamed protein product, partial [Symbiodinium necroappetens]
VSAQRKPSRSPTDRSSRRCKGARRLRLHRWQICLQGSTLWAATCAMRRRTPASRFCRQRPISLSCVGKPRMPGWSRGKPPSRLHSFE